MDSLVSWCEDNNLTLKAVKTKEMIVDMRKKRRPRRPLFIREHEQQRVSTSKYLGVQISDDLSWSLSTTQLVKRAQQQPYFLRRLRKFGTSPEILSNFYSCIAESILTGCITVWYGSTSAVDRKHLQRVLKAAETITRTPPPSLQSIYTAESTGELPPSSKPPPTPSTICSHFCPQARGTEVLNPRAPD